MTAEEELPRRYQDALDWLAANPGSTISELAEGTGLPGTRAGMVLREAVHRMQARRYRANRAGPWRYYLIEADPPQAHRPALARLVDRQAWVEIIAPPPSGARWRGRLIALADHPTMVLDTGRRQVSLPQDYPVHVLPEDGAPVPVTREQLIAALAGLGPLSDALDLAAFADDLLARLRDGA